MEKVLKLYKYVDGVNDAPFPNDKEQVVISSFRYDAKRMGGAPTISCSFMHHLCLDKMWDYNVYAFFNGEKYFVKQIPTSSYDNTDSRYKHELELASERVILDNVYVYDVVDSDSLYDKPVSNSSKFAFFGDIHEFASRLNQSLKYSKVGYSVVVDSGISSDAMMVSFQDQFFSNAIQESYNTYNIPYYFVGKVIHFGYTNNAIAHTFKYGQDESLLSIQKQNANYKVVNRVTGVGSEDNIPYYYPNDYESKEEVEANGGTWINPQTNLMPSIYRESLGDERFYNALNNTYRIPNSNKYYEFANPYVEGKPKEHIVNFEDIKPTIKGITNANGLRIDMFQEFAYDLNDNDKTDEEGNYLHPYFFAKLRRFDGDYGFNLFGHSIDEGEMTISMTSGSCGACEWTIGVLDDSQKNPVQVDENGNLKRDKEGNVIRSGTPQDRQNDTQNYEVWIALRKDIDTFGVIMPNATNNYKPSVNDTFVILHIDLPKAYIIAAEDNLKAQLIEYMSLNNSEKFNFSISFSRIFFAEHPDILAQLNENARIQIEYNEERYELYVSSFSYSMSNDKPLPEIRVELSDTLTIAQNAIQTAISEVKDDILSNIGNSQDFLKQGLRYFLRKDTNDRSKGTIASDKGFEAGRFVSGFLGGTGAWIGADGYGEMSNLTLRESLRVPDFIFNRVDVVSGELWNAPAFGTLEDVDTENMIASVRLESNERCGLHVGDFCRGIFADFGGGNNWEGEDECGFMHLYGFWTSYFTPTEILDNEEGLFRFKYELKPDTTQHPTKSMKFAVYGNPTEKSRQASAYSTRTYKRYLNNVTTWVIDPDKHIYAQYGDLNGLQIGGVKMQGYGSFQSNAYFRGVQIQLPPEQMESLKGDSAYAAQLSSYVGTIKLDADGNMIGGISEETNVTALDEYGVVSNVTALDEQGIERNVVVTTNKLTTTVQAYKGSTPLYYSSAAVKGGFTLALDCVGCTASVVNGAIIVNSITDTKDCRINITVNCEGMAVYNLEYNVVFVQDGKNGQNVSMYEISPATNIIKKTSSGVEPSSITFSSWKREGGSRSKFVAQWFVFGWKDSKVGQGTRLNDTTVWSDSYTFNFASHVNSGYTYFEVQTDDSTFVLATSDVAVVKDGEDGESYEIIPNITAISKTMTGTLEPESVKFMLQANKGGVIKYYPTVWSLKGRNLANGEWTTLKSANSTTTGFDVVFTANYKYYELSAKTYGDGDVMLGDTLNISIVADGKDGKDGADGEKGASGAMPRYRGEFVPNNESEPYVYDGEYRDIVIYEGDVFQVYQYGSAITDPPSIAPNADNDGKWQRASKFRFVAMDTALIDSANIGGFMFKRTKYIDGVPVGKLQSQYGPVVIRDVNKSSGNSVPVTIKVTSESGTTNLTSYIIKTQGNYAYSLNPSTRLVTLDENGNPSVPSVSCSLVQKSASGESTLSSVPSGYTLRYSREGSSEQSYTPNSSISVPTSEGSTIIFRLRDSNSNIVAEELVYVFSENSTQGTILFDRYIQLACNEDGSVKFGLPYRFRVSQWQGGKEVPLTNIVLSGSGITIDNERIELDAETGTLKATNVELTGVINAVSGTFNNVDIESGFIGDWNISQGSMVVSGTFEDSSWRSDYKNTLDIRGMHVSYGDGGITADFGTNMITFNKEGTEWFSALALVDNQSTSSRRTDKMCGVYIKGNNQDIGLLVEGCGMSYIHSDVGTNIYGLSLNTRVVSTTSASELNDDVIVFNNTSAITFTLDAASPSGKVLFLKRVGSGSVTVKGNLRLPNSSDGVLNTTRNISAYSMIYVKTDAYWTEFYCG